MRVAFFSAITSLVGYTYFGNHSAGGKRVAVNHRPCGQPMHHSVLPEGGGIEPRGRSSLSRQSVARVLSPVFFRYVKNERTVVRICCGRGCWQAVRSAGLGSTGGYGACSRRPSGLRANPEIFLVIPYCPHTSGVRKKRTAVRISTISL